MSGVQGNPEALREFSVSQLQGEIERRECAADQHEPYNWVRGNSGHYFGAFCRCGEARYRIELQGGKK